MTGYDAGTEHGLSGGFRFYPGNSVDGHCIHRPGARLHLGYLGVTRHLPCLAERASRFVRRALEHVARQHRAHGVGFLSAVGAMGRYRIGSGASPVFTTGGNPVCGELLFRRRRVTGITRGNEISTGIGRGQRDG